MKAKLVAVAALCFILLPAGARAQIVYTYSEVQIFEDSDPDWALGVAIMDVGYGTQMYYDMGLSVVLYKTNEPYGWDRREYGVVNDTYCGGSAYLDYDPAGEYETEFFPGMLPHFQNQDGASVDHYNYGEYLDGVPVLWPGGAGAYEFYGAGPEVDSGSYIPLGTLNSVFSNGSTHGEPDHVVVMADNISDYCNDAKQRIIKYRVVASDGRRAARCNTEERFYNQQNGIPIPFVWNSCRSENVSPTSCSPNDSFNDFEDGLKVGCPLVSGDCGYSPFVSEWRWCARDRSSKHLTSNVYDIRRNSILINGATHYNKWTALY
jgi:hypothetical protein